MAPAAPTNEIRSVLNIAPHPARFTQISSMPTTPACR